MHGLVLENNIIQFCETGTQVNTSDTVVSSGTPRYLFRGNVFRNNTTQDCSMVGPTPTTGAYAYGVAFTANSFQGPPPSLPSIDANNLQFLTVSENHFATAGSVRLNRTVNAEIRDNTFVRMTRVPVNPASGTSDIAITNDCFLRTARVAAISFTAGTLGANRNAIISNNSFIGNAGPAIRIQNSRDFPLAEYFDRARQLLQPCHRLDCRTGQCARPKQHRCRT